MSKLARYLFKLWAISLWVYVLIEYYHTDVINWARIIAAIIFGMMSSEEQ